MKISLKELEDNFADFIYLDIAAAKRIHLSKFSEIPLDQLMVYRKSIRSAAKKRIGDVMNRTKRYFSMHVGVPQWKSLENEFLAKHQVGLHSFASSLIEFVNLIPQHLWLRELADYELVRTIVKFDFRETNSSNINPTMVLRRYRYDIPKWYREWLNSEQGLSHEKDLEKLNQVEEGNSENESKPETDTDLPAIPSLADPSEVRVAIYRDHKFVVRSLVVNLALFTFLEETQNGKSVHEAFAASQEKGFFGTDSVHVIEGILKRAMLL